MKKEEILYAKSPLNNKVYKLVPPKSPNGHIALLTCTTYFLEDTYLVDVSISSAFKILFIDSIRTQISKNEYVLLRNRILNKTSNTP